MPKKILMLFQDCYACDDSEWYEQQLETARSSKVAIVPTPHDFPKAKALIITANDAGYKKLPVFTDGQKFAYDIADFVGNPTKRKSKKN